MFYWAITQIINLKYFKYVLRDDDEGDILFMIEILKNAKIDQEEYNFKSLMENDPDKN